MWTKNDIFLVFGYTFGKHQHPPPECNADSIQPEVQEMQLNVQIWQSYLYIDT